MNAFLLLSGLGMMMVGLIAIVWWKRKGVAIRYFFAGMLAWVAAISVKLLMDLTITAPMLGIFAGSAAIYLLVSGLYLGLRTGLLESGISFLAIKRFFGKMGYREAMAFGIGFGSIEAILIGFSSFLSIATLLVMPGVLESLPDAVRQQLTDTLNQSTLVVIPPILERAMVLTMHVFATLLVVLSVNLKRKDYLLYSILFKALLDGIVPLLLYLFPAGSLLNAYLIELPIAGLFLVSLYGIRHLRHGFRPNKQ